MAQLKSKRTEDNNLSLARVHHMKTFRSAFLYALLDFAISALHIKQSRSDQASGVTPATPHTKRTKGNFYFHLKQGVSFG
jgi:hypothetical protein